MSEPTLTHAEALDALNRLRSNVTATQNASWSNAQYPLVAILNAAGFQDLTKTDAVTDADKAEHLACYGGAGGWPRKDARPVPTQEGTQ